MEINLIPLNMEVKKGIIVSLTTSPSGSLRGRPLMGLKKTKGGNV
jgi:hypothetical protein